MLKKTCTKIARFENAHFDCHIYVENHPDVIKN